MAYTGINKSSDYFNTATYTGTGSNNTISNTFQSDMIWVKGRNVSTNHSIQDAVRGYTAGTVIYPNLTNAQGSFTDTGYIQSVASNNFVVGTGTHSDDANYNNNGSTYVAWNWKAGTTSGITQGGASITPSSYSINATAGFSIIKWQGTNAHASVPHGLGVAPKMIIIRRLESSSSWVVYHHSIGNTKRLTLDSNAAESGASGGWFNNTSPTADLFHVGTDGGSNGSTDNYIAYCFRDVVGYSKFGKFLGNGNADGTFIYTGFKPQLVMLKQSSGTTDWAMNDIKRQQYNAQDIILYANSNGAESGYSGNFFDILSNGFKQRMSGSYYNGSGNTYIYMAFAEAPLVGTNNVPCTAR